MGEPFDFVALLRGILASINIFFANLINSCFDLIDLLLDLNIMEKFGNEILNRVYTLVGIFVLFKAAIIVIRYVIAPEQMLDKTKGGKKFVINILVSLVMITSAPTVFKQLFNLQTIILDKNILGKLFFGESSESTDLSGFGRETTYFLFSNFIDYDRNSDFEFIFKDCPNIFKEADMNFSTGEFGNYCCSGDSCQYTYYRCATYLTKGANVSMDFSSISNLNDTYYIENFEPYDERSNIILGQFNSEGKYKNASYFGPFLASSFSDYKYVIQNGSTQLSIGYNTCNEHMVNAGYCGVDNGIKLYWDIQKGRINHDVSLILSKEVVTAKNGNYLLYLMKNARGEATSDYNDINVEDLTGEVCSCDISGNSRDAEACNKSSAGGGFVFDFDFFLPLVLAIIYLIVMFFLCIDIGIRAIKLAFLRVMSPIAFVSYMDVTESKLFTQWVKLFFNTYLDLFIKLSCIYLAYLLSGMLINGDIKFSVAGDDYFANIIFMIGCFFFAKQLPDFILKSLNLGGDKGSISYMKKALSYMTGLGKRGVSGAGAFVAGAVGGSVANTVGGFANLKNNLKNNDSKLGKAGVVARAVANPLTGFVSGGVRSFAKQASASEKFSMKNVSAGVSESVWARKQNETPNDEGKLQNIFRRNADKFRELAGTKEYSETLNKEETANKLEEAKKENKKYVDELNKNMVKDGNYSEVLEAFSNNDKTNPYNFNDSLKYKNYSDYSSKVSNPLTEEVYNKYYDLYKKKFDSEMKIKKYEKLAEESKNNNNS